MTKVLVLWEWTFLQLIGLVGSFEDQHVTKMAIFLLMKTVILHWLQVNGNIPLNYEEVVLSADI